MSRLKIVIDLGSSATKVVYTWGDQPLKQFMMSPFCATVPVSYPQQRSWGGLENHLEASWVTVAEECALLGRGAEKHYGSSIANDELKKQKALFKCLGILAAIQLEHGQKSPLPIDLGVLLPFDEYLTRESLIEGLLTAATAVAFCGRPVSLNINDVKVMPEGAGLFTGGLPARLRGKLVQIAVLVIGHRNLSWLLLQGGQPIPDESHTNLLGFRWLVDEVQVRSGYKDELGLTKMIFSGEGVTPALEATIRECLPVYWQEVEHFLREQSEAEYVLCGGGAAAILQQQLKGCFGRKLGWTTELTKGLKQFGIRDLIERRRLADAYGVLKTL